MDATEHSRRTALFVVLVVVLFVLLSRWAILTSYVAEHPAARALHSDPAVYWFEAGRVASGVFVDDQPFHYTPLYPYFLGFLRALRFRIDQVAIVQLLLHLVTVLVIVRIAWSKFGSWAGVMAGFLFAFSAEPAWLLTRLLPSTVQLLLVSLFLLVLERHRVGQSQVCALLIGLTGGAVTLAYPPAVLLGPIIVIWLLQRRKVAVGMSEDREMQCSCDELIPTEHPEASKRVGFVIGGFCGFAMMLVLPIAHNWQACGEFIPLTAHAGITLRQGNTIESTGVYTRVAGVDVRKERMHQDVARVVATELGLDAPPSYRTIDRFFVEECVSFWLEHPFSAGVLALRKAYWFFTGTRFGDIYGLALEREQGLADWTKTAPIQTPLLIGTAIAGFVLLRKHGTLTLADAAMFLVPAFVVVLFFYSPRYRLPILPIACIASAGLLSNAIACLFNVKNRSILRARSEMNRVDLSPRGLIFAGICSVLGVLLPALNPLWGFDRTEDFRGQFAVTVGELYLRTGDVETAHDLFVEAVELESENSDALAGLLDTLTQLGYVDEARPIADRLAKTASSNPDAWLKLGGFHLRLSEWEQAIRAFEVGLKEDADPGKAHLGLSIALGALGQEDAAWRHLTEAVRLSPEDRLVLIQYGSGLASMGRMEEAEAVFRKMLVYAPDDAEIHYRLGAVLLELDRRDEARKSIEEALLCDPYHAGADRLLQVLIFEDQAE